MGYLKTVLTYHQPSEAEVDKAFLESHGLTVCLLNANTSRNELGAPFYIQLQVADEEYASAVEILKTHNPERFGSAARVAELDRQIKSAAVWFMGAAVVAAIAVFLTMGPSGHRLENSVLGGGIAGTFTVFIRSKLIKAKAGTK